MKTRQLVINYHITEKCNYHCQYCFAHWSDGNKALELHKNIEDVKQLLKNLANYFLDKNNVIYEKHHYDSVRINFAGGEPLILGTTLKDIINHAHKLEFKISIITNGSLLKPNLLKDIAKQVDMLGLSYDSTSKTIVEKIGRMTKNIHITENELIEMIKIYRSINPLGMVKINTVVNQYNWQDDMSDIIRAISPEKWKVLDVLPIYAKIADIKCSPKQFDLYIERHRKNNLPIQVESNNAMLESYLMINPYGCFYQNNPENNHFGYIKSEPINKIGVENAIKQIRIDMTKFKDRY